MMWYGITMSFPRDPFAEEQEKFYAQAVQGLECIIGPMRRVGNMVKEAAAKCRF